MDAAAHELRPLRNRGLRISLLGKQAPQVWVVPAKLVQGGVAMLADGGAQLACFRNQFRLGQSIEIFVHGMSPEVPLRR